MDSWCEGKGCPFHKFPYVAQIPVRIDKKYERRTFTCEEDVHDIIKLLIKETEDFNNEGKSFDVALSVSKQLPFFSCMNILYNQEAQENVAKYIYCKEFGISPYPGSFGEQPKKWVDRAFLIKKALAKREESMINKQKEGVNNG